MPDIIGPLPFYEATLKTSSDTLTYIGLTEGPFKTKYYGHKQTFTHNKYRNGAEASKKLWELKDRTWSTIFLGKCFNELTLTKKADRDVTCVHALQNPSSLN